MWIIICNFEVESIISFDYKEEEFGFLYKPH